MEIESVSEAFGELVFVTIDCVKEVRCLKEVASPSRRR